ncbi:helix-turn-helix transcriptional regulator [Nonomuraea cavernae]|uniref:LuxR family transcriptional regulator n=1 Tax=Nonomuraea cavernae TaxID=2045107 RepID=A0A918DT67_9ACTN|nr:LuxR family transcriptional regulator [Nonomuraea cavernae]MCA2188787.1 LuxR family transcriptional regulator [Nonomuraea cavernae]GGO81044.1 LuxR family transcriptional regulator [Nonomuraea cavernae]
MFVGRAVELALVRGALRAAGGGLARTIAIEGPEGIGKTALLRHALAEAAGDRAVCGGTAGRNMGCGGTAGRNMGCGDAGCGDAGCGSAADGSTEESAGRREFGETVGVQVLAASGDEEERRLRFGVVRQLLGEVAQDDPWSVGQAVFDELERLQAARPVVVVVDDAQWADRPSLQALAFALRRLRAGRVLALVSCRDLADEWLPQGLRRLLTGGEALRLTLAGLTAADLARLAGQVPAGSGEPAAGPLTARAAARLREHTSGNPLHARALLATHTARRLADPGVRLPAPGTFARPFARRLRAGDARTRALIAACAVLGDPCDLHVAAAVAAALDSRLPAYEAETPPAGDPATASSGVAAWPVAAPEAGGGVARVEALDALEGGVNAGVLEERPGRTVAFRDPLARAAAYGMLGAGARARLHLAAARVVEDTGTALRHRAAAADGPDETLAEELVGFAAKEAQHGLWLEAAAHLELAAGLSEPATTRDELRTAVLEHVLLGGDVVRADELAAAAGPDPRPERRYVLGRLALAAGRFDEAAESLAEAWRDRAPGFAADTAEQLAWLHLVRGDRQAAASWARLAIEQPIQGPAGRPYDVLALSGEPLQGRPHDAPAPPALPVAAGRSRDVPAAQGGPSGGLAGAVRCLRGDDAGAASALLARAVTAEERAGLPHHRLLAGALLAVAEYRDGRWADAVARGERVLAEARELGQRWLLPCLEAVCVAPLVARGEHERALAHASAARAAAREMRHAMGEAAADVAMALLEGGDEPAVTPHAAAATGDPFVPDPRPRLVELLVAEGRLGEAEQELAGLAGVAGQARQARLRGLLLAARNAPAEAEASFEHALGLAAEGRDPLEEGRVLLDLGRLLRRTGRRRAAAERLRAAREVFVRLGAHPLVAGCAQELEACGLEPSGTVRLGLTPQEFSTARLVADGRTNRQIARELLISVKTVEYHIGKIYTKLGIGSRVALASRLAALGDTP